MSTRSFPDVVKNWSDGVKVQTRRMVTVMLIGDVGGGDCLTNRVRESSSRGQIPVEDR